MTKREIILARNALRALEGAGLAGLGREALTEQAGTFAETILSRAELRLQHGEPPRQCRDCRQPKTGTKKGRPARAFAPNENLMGRG